MIEATKKERGRIVGILSEAFEHNKSVNYIVKQDSKRQKRLAALMEYSFDICHKYGKVYLTEDKNACALVLYPDLKKFSLQSLLWDIKLLIRCIGIENASKAFAREKLIKAQYPDDPIYYLWFIGVQRTAQQKGIGSKLLNEILLDSQATARSVYLETSVPENITWYQKNGFSIYHELDFGYTLFMMKRNISPVL